MAKTPASLPYDPKKLPRELRRHYIGASADDIKALLEAQGLSRLSDLYSHVPENVRMEGGPAIPAELSYDDLTAHMLELSNKNHVRTSFLGDGLPHYKTADVVPHVLGIRKLTTAYTPYQPERSQGTLTTIWIYQCAISALTGFEAVNASFYDRSTGLFEAIQCARRLGEGDRDVAVVAETLYPGDVEVLKTLAMETGLELVFVKPDSRTGRVSVAAVEKAAKEAGQRLACIAFPQLNFLGLLEDVDALTDLAESHQARSIAVIDPMTIARGALKPPAAFGKNGASMFVAEGQHLAIAPNFSGPGLGIFGIRFNPEHKNDIRQTAGRFIGKGKDLVGRDAFAIVLSTREQHIRRDKATSNICSNQSYLATLAGASLLEKGDEGLATIARTARDNAVKAVELLTAHAGVDLAFPDAPFWNEICLRLPESVPALIEKARKADLHVGVDASERADGNLLLLSFTDRHGAGDLAKLDAFFAKEFPGKKAPAKAALLPATALRSGSVNIPRVPVDQLKKYYDSLGEQNVTPDDNIYALGSCTMKYNPYVNDWAAGLTGFADLHPQAPLADAQGSLEVMYATQEYFKAITGLPAVTTQPMAGAQGELVGLKLFQAYHRSRGDAKRDIVLIPRSAHGTNPATATMAGYDPANIKLIEADSSGQMNLEQVRSLVAEFGPRISCVMVTNPNTSGVLETNFKAMADLVHGAGGLVYMDGANMNAIAGWLDLGKLGVDAVHNNTHKTWSIPHGGGGPGDAFVAVSAPLAEFLPGHQCVKVGDTYTLEKPARSIGSFQRHFGNFGHKIRCYTYLRALGKEGVPRMSAVAVLSARYLFSKLTKLYPTLPLGAENTPRMHEFILTLSRESFAKVEKAGLPKAVVIPRIGKLFLDFGLHAPTVAFPEVLGLMVEPTETYSKAELDDFLEVLQTIHKIVHETPEVLATVPHFTPIDRVDEVLANKNLMLSEPLTAKLIPVLPNRVAASELAGLPKADLWKKIVQAHERVKNTVHA